MTKCVKVLRAKQSMDQPQAPNGLMRACDWSMLCFALLVTLWRTLSYAETSLSECQNQAFDPELVHDEQRALTS